MGRVTPDEPGGEDPHSGVGGDFEMHFFFAKSPELYQPETLERIRSGEQYSAAEYIQRRREMEEQRRRVQEIFAEVDVLVTPTTSITAPPIAGLKEDPGAMRSAELLLLRNTLPFNVWGLPAISFLAASRKAACLLACRPQDPLAGRSGAVAGSGL